jgi:hypothetical protein
VGINTWGVMIVSYTAHRYEKESFATRFSLRERSLHRATRFNSKEGCNRAEYPTNNPADSLEDATGTTGAAHGKALQSCEKTASDDIADCSLD